MKSANQSVELAPRPTSAAQARRVVRRALRAVDPAMRDIGVLLTSELVTNALLYVDGAILLRITETEDAYRISVSDTSTERVRAQRVSLEATSGRGLALVDRLADSWGVDVHEPDGKEVWFEVPRTP